MPTINEVADLVLRIHREMFGESPSNMKLQKLCYYAQGYRLGETGDTLFSEDFEAWRHGPVCPTLYKRFASYSWQPITGDVADPELPTDLVSHVAKVVEAYGRYDGAYLSTMTHRERPWKETRGNLPEDANSTKVIPKPLIRDYFAEVVKIFQ